MIIFRSLKYLHPDYLNDIEVTVATVYGIAEDADMDDLYNRYLTTIPLQTQGSLTEERLLLGFADWLVRHCGAIHAATKDFIL